MKVNRLPAASEAGGTVTPPHLPPRPSPRRPRRGRQLLGAAALITAVAAALAGWRYGMPRATQAEVVRAGPFESVLSGPGILDALRKASVSASIQGVITTLTVDVGDTLRSGDVVAQLQSADLRAEREALLASHEAARKAVALAEAEVRKANAARNNAQSVLGRRQELIRTGATSRSILEDAQTSMEQSLAEVARAEAAVSQARATEASAEAAVRVAEAQLEKATIRAPIDGVVVARRMDMGDLVVPGSVIVDIVDPQSVVLSARFDESAIARVTKGQPVRLLFTATGDTATPGEIRRIGREVDTETREFTVDIAPRQLPRNWAIGQRGTALITLNTTRDALSVPFAAIAFKDRSPGVFVMRDARAWWQPVELGPIGEARVDVRGGLKAGDVILAQPEGVFAGMKVADPPGARP
ncbi:efflux RND transporter periplasmic adaptor subunit [Xanthobacter autotrophicus]|uniref:efflux RND transporter periplasmic adaptor subunit n=1 Tax=Xanthobacter TaxID=279 RepID=UPI0024AA5BD1|nr:efflux RND transporter periplasmic adaptor subunit [Xanthobacter autotrophicus]MDI4666405.1 efflux RND transporter periplasmic adaptor subunit [Xanthobacter autotrophicus]